MFHACPAIYWRMYIAAKIAKAYYGLLNWIKEKSYYYVYVLPLLYIYINACNRYL